MSSGLPLLTVAVIPPWGPALMTSSDPKRLSKAPSPNTIPPGVRTSLWELGGGAWAFNS